MFSIMTSSTLNSGAEPTAETSSGPLLNILWQCPL